MDKALSSEYQALLEINPSYLKILYLLPSEDYKIILEGIGEETDETDPDIILQDLLEVDLTTPEILAIIPQRHLYLLNKLQEFPNIQELFNREQDLLYYLPLEKAKKRIFAHLFELSTDNSKRQVEIYLRLLHAGMPPADAHLRIIFQYWTVSEILQVFDLCEDSEDQVDNALPALSNEYVIELGFSILQKGNRYYLFPAFYKLTTNRLLRKVQSDIMHKLVFPLLRNCLLFAAIGTDFDFDVFSNAYTVGPEILSRIDDRIWNIAGSLTQNPNEISSAEITWGMNIILKLEKLYEELLEKNREFADYAFDFNISQTAIEFYSALAEYQKRN